MWAKEFEHNGINYRRLGRLSILSNKYINLREYVGQTGIEGYFVNIPCATLYRDGSLEIAPGYKSDGPSGPTFDTKSTMRGSMYYHDPLYQMMRLRKLPFWIRCHADMLLYAICMEDGMMPCRAKYFYEGVAQFAGFAALPS